MDTNSELIHLLRSDNVCVIPTDTVYGVVARLDSPAAVAKIYDVKHRDLNKPVGTILAASLEQIGPLTTPKALNAAAAYWPGPVSVILPTSDHYSYAHKGAMSLAVRIPADKELRALIEQTGPLASSSANLQEQPPATTIAEARAYFGDTVPLYVDGGDLSHRSPSRIIKINSDGSLATVREGSTS